LFGPLVRGYRSFVRSTRAFLDGTATAVFGQTASPGETNLKVGFVHQARPLRKKAVDARRPCRY
jgi:hypothetical protein